MAQELKEIRYQLETYQRLIDLINRVKEESLKEAHRRQKTGKAVGVNSVTKEMYEENLDENIKNLVAEMKAFKYIPSRSEERIYPRQTAS